MALVNVLKMAFRMSDNSSYTIQVPYCKTDLTESVVRGAMNNIVAESIFSIDGAQMAAAVGAKIVKTEETELF